MKLQVKIGKCTLDVHCLYQPKEAQSLEHSGCDEETIIEEIYYKKKRLKLTDKLISLCEIEIDKLKEKRKFTYNEWVTLMRRSGIFVSSAAYQLD